MSTLLKLFQKGMTRGYLIKRLHNFLGKQKLDENSNLMLHFKTEKYF